MRYLILTLIIFAFFSCKKHEITKTVTVTDSSVVRHRDTTIIIHSETVTATNNDSIFKVLAEMKAQGKEPVIIYRNNSDTARTTLTVRLDSSGRVVYDCKSDKKVIDLLLSEIDRYKLIETNITKQPRGIPKYKHYASLTINVILLILIAVLILKK